MAIIVVNYSNLYLCIVQTSRKSTPEDVIYAWNHSHLGFKLTLVSKVYIWNDAAYLVNYLIIFYDELIVLTSQTGNL